MRGRPRPSSRRRAVRREGARDARPGTRPVAVVGRGAPCPGGPGSTRPSPGGRSRCLRRLSPSRRGRTSRRRSCRCSSACATCSRPSGADVPCACRQASGPASRNDVGPMWAHHVSRELLSRWGVAAMHWPGAGEPSPRGRGAADRRAHRPGGAAWRRPSSRTGWGSAPRLAADRLGPSSATSHARCRSGTRQPARKRWTWTSVARWVVSRGSAADEPRRRPLRWDRPRRPSTASYGDEPAPLRDRWMGPRPWRGRAPMALSRGPTPFGDLRPSGP
jgi:hypothetical protein